MEKHEWKLPLEAGTIWNREPHGHSWPIGLTWCWKLSKLQITKPFREKPQVPEVVREISRFFFSIFGRIKKCKSLVWTMRVHSVCFQTLILQSFCMDYGLLDASGIGVSKRWMIYDIWTGPSMVSKGNGCWRDTTRQTICGLPYIPMSSNEHIR